MKKFRFAPLRSEPPDRTMLFFSSSLMKAVCCPIITGPCCTLMLVHRTIPGRPTEAPTPAFKVVAHTPDKTPNTSFNTPMQRCLQPHHTAAGVTQTMDRIHAQINTQLHPRAPKHTPAPVYKEPSECLCVCPHGSFLGCANRAAVPHR